MTQFETIAKSMYEWICNVLFGDIPQNEWYTANLELIRAITTVVLCGVVVLGAIILVVAVMRFLGGLFRGK